MEAIVGMATAPGIGGIGIIRMSGKDSFKVLQNIFVPKNDGGIKGYTMKYGNIIDPKNNEKIDEVLVTYFKSPKSYTAEDMCEINSHGGNYIMQKTLELCLEFGAQLAEPGEFTKRAFLNGRIDLLQAEAVIDIINSKSQREVTQAINKLEGELSRNIKQIREQILDLLSDIEASIDYPEYDIEEVTNIKLLGVLSNIKNKLKSLEKSFNEGKILKEGIKTAIIGTPNSGKSSLLNAILKEERAIVTEYEGTTRDIIEEFILIRGIPIRIIDTAGIRNARSQVEKIGIQKAKNIANNADLILAVFDNTRQLQATDKLILDMIKDKNAIVVLNKCDISDSFLDNDDMIKESGKSILKISAKKRIGLENIYDEIERLFNLDEITSGDETIITNIRHKNLISKSIDCINNVEQSINSNLPIDIVSINIKEILDALGEITGESASDELINNIFSKFCLGK